jgi:hypothetical protein
MCHVFAVAQLAALLVLFVYRNGDDDDKCIKRSWPGGTSQRHAMIHSTCLCVLHHLVDVLLSGVTEMIDCHSLALHALRTCQYSFAHKTLVHRIRRVPRTCAHNAIHAGELAPQAHVSLQLCAENTPGTRVKSLPRTRCATSNAPHTPCNGLGIPSRQLHV